MIWQLARRLMTSPLDTLPFEPVNRNAGNDFCYFGNTFCPFFHRAEIASTHKIMDIRPLAPVSRYARSFLLDRALPCCFAGSGIMAAAA
jgi:hypothetical protein